MLRLQNISTGYGDIAVLKNVSLHVSPGEIVTLIGANGAGKTTLLNTVCGLVRARSGRIACHDREITACSPDEIVRLGISQVPEGRQIFAPLSVLDNLRLGAYVRYRAWGTKKVLARIEQMYALFPRLKERSQQYAGTLSGGEQQMLAIARALMADPTLLVLDEPSMGLAPLVVSEIFKTISQLRDDQKTTIFLVEQNARTALKYADRGYVIETGKIMLEGRSDDLLNNREVQRAYLGRQKQPIWE
jgi:branched-chain amino acid transport system ATP-binding protein